MSAAVSTRCSKNVTAVFHVTFELFELYYWLELYELYYKRNTVHKVHKVNKYCDVA